MRLRPGKVLEIGKGNGLICWYLGSRGVETITIDCDEDLCPDMIGDVRDLPFPDGSFDVVSCCQVLEHLPYTDFPRALNEIFRVTRSHAVMSLPDRYSYYRVFLQVPRIGVYRKVISFPKVARRYRQAGVSHLWEIGLAGSSLRDIYRDIAEADFKINNTFRVFEHPCHRFFVLKKSGP
ncbi:MAG: class I SAM-dependent methyltransferase [Actinobacteria bacterium]|nr:class I SAM-dependent methyltransferase [Actinomycetota bacterium]